MEIMASEVTRPDGTWFISLRTDLDGLRSAYSAADGYSVRLVEGTVGIYGFRLAPEYVVSRHATGTPIGDAAREATASPYIGRRRN